MRDHFRSKLPINGIHSKHAHLELTWKQFYKALRRYEMYDQRTQPYDGSHSGQEMKQSKLFNSWVFLKV